MVRNNRKAMEKHQDKFNREKPYQEERPPSHHSQEGQFTTLGAYPSSQSAENADVHKAQILGVAYTTAGQIISAERGVAYWAYPGVPSSYPVAREEFESSELRN